MATGRLTTRLGNATSSVQEHLHNTNDEINLLHQMKPDKMIGGAMIDVAMIGIATTGNVKNQGETASRLRHQGIAMGARTRMPPTSCSSVSATTSEAGANDSRK